MVFSPEMSRFSGRKLDDRASAVRPARREESCDEASIPVGRAAGRRVPGRPGVASHGDAQDGSARCEGEVGRGGSRGGQKEAKEQEHARQCSAHVECAAFYPCSALTRDFHPGRASHIRNAVSTELMTRLSSMLALVLLCGTAARAQTNPTPEQPRPRPGTILETPGAGRITDAPAPIQPQKPTPGLVSQVVERQDYSSSIAASRSI